MQTTTPAQGGASLLVVEDKSLIAMDVDTMLEQHGFTLLSSAATVEGALKFSKMGGRISHCSI